MNKLPFPLVEGKDGNTECLPLTPVDPSTNRLLPSPNAKVERNLEILYKNQEKIYALLQIIGKKKSGA